MIYHMNNMNCFCPVFIWISHQKPLMGLRLMVERLFVERLSTGGQLVEGQYVKITKFKVYKLLYWKEKCNIFID